MHTLSLTFPVVLKGQLAKRSFARFFWALTISSLIFLSASYIFQINVEMSEKYAAAAYEKELMDLTRKKESLEIGAISSASFNNIVPLLEESFVKAEEVHHLRISKNRIVLDR